MNLSKSIYCNAVQCKKILWLEKHKPNEKADINNDSVLENGNIVHEVARYLYPNHVNIPYNDNLEEMIKDTQSTIESYKNITITEASFKYNNNFCSVDILVKNDNNYEIYEVKSSTALKEIYYKDLSYQYYILKNLGLNIKKCNLIHINSNYVRKGNLELTKLFTITDVTNEIISLQNEVKENIKSIDKYMQNKSEPVEDIDMKCFNPYPCPFFKYCTKHLPSPNVFNIANMHKNNKIKLYKQGIYEYKDLLKEDINEKYIMQIEYELYNKEDYIDKEKIISFLKTLTSPLYFLDFETYQMPIPLYDNVSPYEQVPFLYSIHYMEKENSNIKHLEFLSEPGIDPRRKLAENLVKDIPENTCVLAYNMSFEKTVIKKLAKLYPDLSNHLINIHDNIKDLMIPFKNRDYYTKEMHGSYSIKYVLPALFPNDETLNYKNLDLIHNGTEAMNSFATLPSLDEKDREYIKERLLRYCELDTYAMVKIYQKLIDITK